MKSIKYLVLILSVFVGELAMAQRTISGTVIEASASSGETDYPCVGVNVTFQTAQNRIITGTITDENGKYSLKVPENSTDINVVFSFISMKTQRIAYKGQTELNIKMAEDLEKNEIRQVVVTGKKKNDMGVTDRQMAFAIQRVNMKDILETQPVASIEEALQGQLSGVDILAAGDPGAKSSIRIRGTATLNSSADPLIVVNGVPYSTNIDDNFDFNTANQEDFAQMLSLNPNDIESIEVLKDAASTAVYGTKGANGVLLITTKKGTAGKTIFSLSSKNSMKFEPKSIPMLSGNDYVAYMQDAIWNTANAQALNGNGLLESLFNTPEIGHDQTWRYFDEYNQNVDWLSYLTQNAATLDNSFSMSGGGDKATYRLSLSYLDEGGTTIGTGLTRLNNTIDIGYHFSDQITVNAEYTYSDSRTKSPYSSALRAEAMRKMPNKSPYWIDDATGEMTDTYFTRQNVEEWQGAYTGSTNFHPIIMAKESYNDSDTREQKITVRGNYYPSTQLRFNGYVSMKYKTVDTDQFLPQSATGVTTSSTEANKAILSYSNNFSLQSEFKGMYTNAWLDNTHQLTATALWRTSQSRQSTTSATSYNVSSASIASPSAGSGILAQQGSGISEVRSLSGIGSLVYTFLDRYTINGTVNFEGNSSIARSNRWGIFPALGASWQLADEPFMDWSKKVLTEWKLRASYGTSGNSPRGTSPYYGTYSSLGSYMGGSVLAPNSMQLNNLKWELSNEINIGTDINFWNGMLTMSFDYYKKHTKDLLQEKFYIPTTSGYANSYLSYYNEGEIQNQGVEYRIDWQAFKNDSWNLKFNYNVSRNINEIVSLPSMPEENFTLKNGNYGTRIVPGVAVGSFFGFKSLGVYQNTQDTYAKDANGKVMLDMDGNPITMSNGSYKCYPGDAKYKDINKDGKIDKNDLVYLGNSNPILSGGGGFNLRYKPWTMTVFLHYRIGQKIINQARMEAEGMYNKNNQSTAVLRRWRNEGDVTDLPRALYNYGLNYLGSDRFVEDCSFVRLKTLSLSYNLPKPFLKKLGFTSASVFATGYDLFAFTNYSGQDPEVTLPSKVTDQAKDNSQTPRSRRFSMGLTINF